MDREQYLLELGLILEPERKIISDTILKEKLPVRMNLYNYGMFSIDYFMDDHFMIELEFVTKMEARVSFYQSFEDNHGCQSRIQIMPIKKHVPQNVLKLGHYRDGSYLLNLDNSISESFISAIRQLVAEKSSLIKMCQDSSCYDRDGHLKKSSLLGERKPYCCLYRKKCLLCMELLEYPNLSSTSMKPLQAFTAQTEHMLRMQILIGH